MASGVLHFERSKGAEALNRRPENRLWSRRILEEAFSPRLALWMPTRQRYAWVRAYRAFTSSCTIKACEAVDEIVYKIRTCSAIYRILYCDLYRLN